MFCGIWYDKNLRRLIPICSFKELNTNSTVTHRTAGATKHHPYSIKRFTQLRERALSQGCLLWHSTIWKEKGNKHSPGKLLNKHTVLFMLHIYTEDKISLSLIYIYIYMRYTELGVRYLGQSICKPDWNNKKQVNPWHRSKDLISGTQGCEQIGNSKAFLVLKVSWLSSTIPITFYVRKQSSRVTSIGRNLEALFAAL